MALAKMAKEVAKKKKLGLVVSPDDLKMAAKVTAHPSNAPVPAGGAPLISIPPPLSARVLRRFICDEVLDVGEPQPSEQRCLQYLHELGYSHKLKVRTLD